MRLLQFATPEEVSLQVQLLVEYQFFASAAALLIFCMGRLSSHDPEELNEHSPPHSSSSLRGALARSYSRNHHWNSRCPALLAITRSPEWPHQLATGSSGYSLKISPLSLCRADQLPPDRLTIKSACGSGDSASPNLLRMALWPLVHRRASGGLELEITSDHAGT